MDIWNVSILGVDFYHIVSWLILYSFWGWIWETTYVSLKQGRYVNRGFINGPLCTIYGFGAVSVYLILRPFEAHLPLLFFGGIAVATVLEYATSVLMEGIFHTTWWDYSDRKFNFQGRICLEASLAWGCFTVILFRVLQPVAENTVSMYPRRAGEIGVCAVGILYLADFSSSAAAAFRLRDHMAEWEKAMEQKREELQISLGKKLAELEQARAQSVKSVKERLEEREHWKELGERHAALRQQLAKELEAYRAASVSRLGRSTRRYLNAYPNLNRGYRLRHRNKKEENKA